MAMGVFCLIVTGKDIHDGGERHDPVFALAAGEI
jgi:hypothetical protein